MQVVLTDPARDALKAIYDYYVQEGYDTYADDIRKTVISKARSLPEAPYKGQEEPLLTPLKQGHRYVIAKKHYKVIYLIEADIIYVTDVFDTRQDPVKMLKRHRK